MSGTPTGAHDQISITIRQLRVCCGAPSLTRGRICSLQLLLGLASAFILGAETHRTHDHISTVSDLRLPQPKGLGPCIYIPQEQGGPVILDFTPSFHLGPPQTVLRGWSL
jgi:hypothetical protein